MKITLLVDQGECGKLQSEFGLAFLLESAAGDYLFDTGAESALHHNLAILNIPPEKVSKVILSHGHYDHTGGLSGLSPQIIYCCRDIIQPHYSYHGPGDVHHISMPEASQQVLKNSPIHFIDHFSEIAPGVYLTGPIPRKSFEDCGGKFYHDCECTLPDTVSEEQALLTADGVLISGCCHAGIINTLEYCRKIHPEITIHTIIGGLHLRNAAPERLQATAEYLQNSSVKTLYLMHCTGLNAIDFLQNALPGCTIKSPCPGDSWCC